MLEAFLQGTSERERLRPEEEGEIDQRHVERLLDADDLGAGLLVLVEHLEHPAGELEQALLRVLLGEPDRPVAGLEVSVAFEVGLDVGETRRLALAPEQEGCGAWIPELKAGAASTNSGSRVKVREPMLTGFDRADDTAETKGIESRSFRN